MTTNKYGFCSNCEKTNNDNIFLEAERSWFDTDFAYTQTEYKCTNRGKLYIYSKRYKIYSIDAIPIYDDEE